MKEFSIFSSGDHFVTPDGTTLAILVNRHMRNVLRNYFEIVPLQEMSFKVVFFFSILSSGNHFVQLSGTILAILVKGQKRNFSVKLF